jgi:glycerol uptake facilitator-like aquaporin
MNARGLRVVVSVEATSTALLVLSVIGSGIMAERLSGGIDAITLLANAIATGCALFALISVFGPVSGAHMNPLVTLREAFERRVGGGRAGAVIAAQCGGAFAGAILANVIFGEPPLSAATNVRTGLALLASESVAACALVLIVAGTTGRPPHVTGAVVGAWIAGAYWFTSSTSFANPAVTMARSASDTFTGIRPADVPGFIAAQLVGGVVAMPLARWWFR